MITADTAIAGIMGDCVYEYVKNSNIAEHTDIKKRFTIRNIKAMPEPRRRNAGRVIYAGTFSSPSAKMPAGRYAPDSTVKKAKIIIFLTGNNSSVFLISSTDGSCE